MNRRRLMGVVAALGLALAAFANGVATAEGSKEPVKMGCCCGSACLCPGCACDGKTVTTAK